MFISESKLNCTLKISAIVKTCGFSDFYFVPSCGSSGGMFLMWHNSLHVQLIRATDFAITVLITNAPSWYLTGVYGPTNHLLKPNFWQDLTSFGSLFDGLWCVAGDFNAILEQKDKIGGRPFASGSVCRFKRFIDDRELIDLSFTGNPFTWNNRRVVEPTFRNGLIAVWAILNGVCCFQRLPSDTYRR